MRESRLSGIAREAMRDHGLLPDFSPDAVSETNSLSQAAMPNDVAIRDLRQLPWVSIDNDDSLDLDQLSASGTDGAGNDVVYVAVADVDALVTKDSPIDAHASANTTSVYTAAGVFPMLPEKLSTNLTSLNEGEERLAIVVQMTIARDGELLDSGIYRAVVRNRAKLAYNGVAAWLAGSAAPPDKIAGSEELTGQLRMQSRIAKALKTRRESRGALELDTLETRPLFSDGTLKDLAPDASNVAKELIEDFMVAANGVTARFLAAKAVPSLRRVLPPPERWSRIVALAANLGAPLPATPDAVALQAFLRARSKSDPASFAELSLSIVKLLGAGEYALVVPGKPSPGHFALAVGDYTHSTAPNRRFPDLVTQRLVKAALAAGAAPYSNEELAAIAAHCTVQERNAAKVERQVAKAAAAILLSSRIGERFDGVVTGASEKGTWVRISHPTTEGRLVRGFENLDVGDRVPVKLVRTDPARGYIDFARAEARR